ncbi:cytidylate kinase family protein [Candidatus Marsarchaeota archaeon]|nr:cytidylate kinase family protein [Candidatus Marsarchaeota archaeon]
MIKICISGLSSSGKTTIGNMISEKLGLLHVNHSYKHYAKSNDELLDILKKSNEKFVKNFDAGIVEAAKKGDCVITTWLGPWLVKDATIRIWLEAGINERAKRYAENNNIAPKTAEEFLRTKDLLTIAEFKTVYNIDIMEHSFFDLCINTEKVGTDDIVDIIEMLAKNKRKNAPWQRA